MITKEEIMKKRTKIIFWGIGGALLLLTAVFFLYVSNYYHADQVAINAFQYNSGITENDGNLTLVPSSSTDTGIIFYPGGKVEYTAYLPLLTKLQQQGYTCILINMPFNLAVFDKNAADDIFDEYPEITNWYIAGHSLGGAMASSYMADHPDKLNGLILLGSYMYGSVPSDKALVIYGSKDQVLDRSKINSEDQVVLIEGGNHAQFGDYGSQSGDGIATISSEEQQTITVNAIADFVQKTSN